VGITVTANVARSPEEATKQARGERVTGGEPAEEAEVAPGVEELLEPPTEQPA
jgi:hypothetical protein